MVVFLLFFYGFLMHGTYNNQCLKTLLMYVKYSNSVTVLEVKETKYKI